MAPRITDSTWLRAATWQLRVRDVVTVAAVRGDLRRGLAQAIAARDVAAVSALRSALAALDNAEAADAPPSMRTGAEHPSVAGSVPGVGATEVERRVLTDAQVLGLIRAEVDERLAAARDYEHLGRGERAGRLRAEAQILSEYLPGQVSPA